MGLSDIFTSLKSQGRSHGAAGAKVKVVKSTQPTKLKRNASPQQKQTTVSKKKGKMVKGKTQRGAKGPRKAKGVIVFSLC